MVLLSYLIFFFLIIVHFLLHSTLTKTIVILYMIVVPLVSKARLLISFSLRRILEALVISIIIVGPFLFVMSLSGIPLRLPTSKELLYGLVVVAIPEEVFFRGFIQDRLGNNLWAIIITSLLFSLSHLPRAVAIGSIIPVLSFFPSLMMGYLYMKKRDLLYPIVFHWISNIAV